MFIMSKNKSKMPMSEFVISFDISEYKDQILIKDILTYRKSELFYLLTAIQAFGLEKTEYHNISLFKRFLGLERKRQVMFNVQSLCTQIIVNAARSCMTKKSLQI